MYLTQKMFINTTAIAMGEEQPHIPRNKREELVARYFFVVCGKKVSMFFYIRSSISVQILVLEIHIFYVPYYWGCSPPMAMAVVYVYVRTYIFQCIK